MSGEQLGDIILYDGNCLMCNNFITFVLNHSSKIYRVVDQNDKNFVTICEEWNIKLNNSETIYLLENSVMFDRSTAIYRILRNTNFSGKLMATLIKIFPKKLRDYFYVIVSVNRQFINKRYCKLPRK